MYISCLLPLINPGQCPTAVTMRFFLLFRDHTGFYAHTFDIQLAIIFVSETAISPSFFLRKLVHSSACSEQLSRVIPSPESPRQAFQPEPGQESSVDGKRIRLSASEAAYSL